MDRPRGREGFWREYRKIIVGAILSTLIGMAITSPLFQLFIVEEAQQQVGFAVSAFNFNKLWGIALSEGWYDEASSLMGESMEVANSPIPIFGLVRAYWLYYKTALFNFRAQLRVAVERFKLENQTGVQPAFARVCRYFGYDYRVAEYVQDSLSAAQVEALIRQYVAQGYHIKEMYSKVVEKIRYQVIIFEKVEVEETTVPSGTVCPEQSATIG